MRLCFISFHFIFYKENAPYCVRRVSQVQLSCIGRDGFLSFFFLFGECLQIRA